MELLESKRNLRAIVTDLHIPGMDGFELIETIRAHQVQRRLPIIVITGCTDPATRRNGYAGSWRQRSLYQTLLTRPGAGETGAAS